MSHYPPTKHANPSSDIVMSRRADYWRGERYDPQPTVDDILLIWKKAEPVDRAEVVAEYRYLKRLEKSCKESVQQERKRTHEEMVRMHGIEHAMTHMVLTSCIFQLIECGILVV